MNKEFIRMQQLAGLITENQYKQTLGEENQDQKELKDAEKDAESGLKSALGALKAGASSVKVSPKDKEIKEGVALTLGLVASAPGMMSALGGAANKISSFFQKDKKKGTVVGNALKKWGHALEDAYVGAIGAMLVKAFPSTYKGQDVRDQTSPLYDAAHGIYAGLLAAAAVASGMGAAEAHSVIAKGLEGGLSAFKSSEVIGLAQKIAAA